MNKETFLRLEIGSLLYNLNSTKVVHTISGFIDTKELKENDSISFKDINDHSEYYILTKNCNEWELLDDNAPDSIKIKVITAKLLLLEEFVHSRLK